mmetsp:Transcript_58845/g.128846  ORF Transcript_58845/g.128846 Transcript_58845/m.128846 type:complete len:113 (-) Transcript_58845:95-433(-)
MSAAPLASTLRVPDSLYVQEPATKESWRCPSNKAEKCEASCEVMQGIGGASETCEKEELAQPTKRRKILGRFGTVVVDVTRMAAFSMAGHIFGGGSGGAGVGFATACAKALL